MIDIGRRSLTSLTGVPLGAGVISAVRYTGGKTPEATDIITIIVTTSYNSCAQSRYTHYGTLALPDEVFSVRANIRSILSLE